MVERICHCTPKSKSCDRGRGSENSGEWPIFLVGGPVGGLTLWILYTATTGLPFCPSRQGYFSPLHGKNSPYMRGEACHPLDLSHFWKTLRLGWPMRRGIPTHIWGKAPTKLLGAPPWGRVYAAQRGDSAAGYRALRLDLVRLPQHTCTRTHHGIHPGLGGSELACIGKLGTAIGTSPDSGILP